MVDPGITKGGGRSTLKSLPIARTHFPENYMKMKTIGLGAHIKFYYVDPPLLNVRIFLIRLFLF